MDLQLAGNNSPASRKGSSPNSFTFYPFFKVFISHFRVQWSSLAQLIIERNGVEYVCIYMGTFSI